MVNNKMKKTYISPSFLTVTLNMRSNLLVDSGTGVTADPNSSVSSNFVRENNTVSDVNVWDNEW